MDSSDIFPISLDEIERADYILLSHIHFDHAQDIQRILEKFPKARLFVGDLSTDALCTFQHISLTNVYRVRGGEEYVFDDVRLQVFSGRHTENANGVYRSSTVTSDPESLGMWFGSLELMNYLITAGDGTRVLLWAGMTTPDQKHRLQGLNPDIAVMHLSPKQDPAAFAELAKAIGAQVVIPHHHDMTEPLMNSRPEIQSWLPEEAKKAYIRDGKFSGEAFVNRFAQTMRAYGADLMELEHHKWYRFGLAFQKL